MRNKPFIETAVRLGATTILAEPGHTLNDQNLDDGWSRLAESLFSICDFAAHYDVLIAITPGNEYKTDLINTSIQAMDMIDELDCDNLGVIFDIGHTLTMGEEITSSINTIGDQLCKIRISGFEKKHQDYRTQVQMPTSIPMSTIIKVELSAYS